MTSLPHSSVGGRAGGETVNGTANFAHCWRRATAAETDLVGRRRRRGPVTMATNSDRDSAARRRRAGPRSESAVGQYQQRRRRAPGARTAAQAGTISDDDRRRLYINERLRQRQDRHRRAMRHGHRRNRSRIAALRRHLTFAPPRTPAPHQRTINADNCPLVSVELYVYSLYGLDYATV